MRRRRPQDLKYDTGTQTSSRKRKEANNATGSDSDEGSPNKIQKTSLSGDEEVANDRKEDTNAMLLDLDEDMDQEDEEVMTMEISNCRTDAEDSPAEHLRSEKEERTDSVSMGELRYDLRRRPIRPRLAEEGSRYQTENRLPLDRGDTLSPSWPGIKEKQKVQVTWQKGLAKRSTDSRYQAEIQLSNKTNTLLHSRPGIKEKDWQVDWTKGVNRTNQRDPNYQISEAPYLTASTAVPYLPERAFPSRLTAETRKKGDQLKYFAAIFLIILVILLTFWSLKTNTSKREIDFSDILLDVKSAFPSQRVEFWKRCTIHLQRHLRLAQPTEPVSMILTSGYGAKETLRCLADRLATAFSSHFHNASILHIDGASRAALDSDQVKLDMDQKMTGAFEGGQMAAVIHRFDDLPPASTLIFYRYCDHENAAYKAVFLVFTVLLPVEELDSKLSLNAVEEKVQDHIQSRFVSTNQPGTFNQMDHDKFGGLWSRISHLILPVSVEENIERNGCTR
ncbi:torsin-1A-interacting protein 1-like isoform X2 [Paramormyrops kingsleyae]|uniref:Torsin-1A-interacting protein 1-like n=1 Tax=Paramormyrops kingsleyae TaxID=1676925 RepID=A0A3B3T6L1_9TELE|nr:torsin-1A-interacting protein 1-like isoform X2 [Paramormyrops kingsleyae]